MLVALEVSPNAYLLGLPNRADPPIDSVEVKGQDFRGL